MKIIELSQQLLLSRIIGDSTISVQSLEIDSRQVQPGGLFFCLPGIRSMATITRRKRSRRERLRS